MTDETRTRFLAAIAAQLPAERIAEVHLFPAIRQGGMESGVAVVALEREGELAAPEAPHGADVDVALPRSNEADAFTDEAGSSEPSEVESPYADDADSHDPDSDDPDSDVADSDDGQADDETAAPARPRPRRYTVYSARYRHTLKGPERGKWEVNVTEEADAPLLTVDAVVRGVQRRSGDVDEIVRLSGDEVRAALPVAAAP